MCGWHKLQYNDQCCRLYSLYCVCCRYTEKCDLYNNRKHRMYSMRSGIHIQYNDECRDLYNLCCCLRRRNHLSIHRMYCNNEQGMFSLYCMCCWYMEKCDMYSNSQHCVYITDCP